MTTREEEVWSCRLVDPRSLAVGKLYEAAKDEKRLRLARYAFCALGFRLSRGMTTTRRDTSTSWDAIPHPPGIVANVNEIDEYGRLGTGRCLVPLGGLAQGDVMLAQKIALETDESRALSVANSFPGPIGWRLLCRCPLEGRGSRVRLFPS